MRGATRLSAAPAVGPSGRPAGKQQEQEPQTEDVVAPSLPRGNRLVARTKTSPGFGRSSSPSRVTPVALSRSQLARYSGGAAPESHRLPYPHSRYELLSESRRRGSPAQCPHERDHHAGRDQPDDVRQQRLRAKFSGGQLDLDAVSRRQRASPVGGETALLDFLDA